MINETEIIPLRFCGVDMKYVFYMCFLFIATSLGLQLILSIEYSILEVFIVYTYKLWALHVLVLLMMIVILLRLKRGYFYNDRFEFKYPFLFWNKRTYKVAWSDLSEAKTRKPLRELRRVKLRFQQQTFKFQCSEAEIKKLKCLINIPIDGDTINVW